MKNKLKQGTKMLMSFFAGILVFFGVLTTLASWPEAPSGSVPGGWLGTIFDLDESGTEKLVVNSENLTIPNNTAITENKQITTKEYVDNRVSAVDSVSGATDAFCVANIYSNYGNGYVCDINIPGYTRINGSSGCCFTKVGNGTGKRIFVTGIGYRGNLGGEIGADAKCQARADLAGLDGTFKAWLLDGTHEQYIYKKFPDTSYYNMKGVKVITTFEEYNGDMIGFQDLEVSIAYDEFGRYMDHQKCFTGLSSNGNFAGNINSCQGFTVSNSSDYANIGYLQYLDKYWFSYYSTSSCSTLNSLICVEI